MDRQLDLHIIHVYTVYVHVRAWGLIAGGSVSVSILAMCMHYLPYVLYMCLLYMYMYVCVCVCVQYLPLIQEGRSPLLHTHTFLLTRLSHLHFCLERAWTVSDLAIATLHAMARQMRTLQVSMCMLMRDAEGRKIFNETSKVKQTTKQSNTTHPRQSLLQRKELPQVGFEPTTLYTLSRQNMYIHVCTYTYTHSYVPPAFPARWGV